MHHESACINKFCFTAEWQLINVEKVMEMETHCLAAFTEMEGYQCDLGVIHPTKF